MVGLLRPRGPLASLWGAGSEIRTEKLAEIFGGLMAKTETISTRELRPLTMASFRRLFHKGQKVRMIRSWVGETRKDLVVAAVEDDHIEFNDDHWGVPQELDSRNNYYSSMDKRFAVVTYGSAATAIYDLRPHDA